MTPLVLSSAPPPPRRLRRMPIPPRISAMSSSSAAEVGGDVADAEPGWVLGQVVEVLLGVRPFRADAHDDVAGQGDREQGLVREAAQVERLVAPADDRRRRSGDERRRRGPSRRGRGRAERR